MPTDELVKPKKKARVRLELHMRRLGLVEPADSEPQTGEEGE
jgi:hypothetical protein